MHKLVVGIVTGCLTVGLMAATAGASKPPKSCLNALNAAESIVGLNIEYSKDVQAMFASQGDASRTAQADGTIDGVSTFISTLTDTMNTLAGQVTELTTRIAVQVDSYNRAAKSCRAGK